MLYLVDGTGEFFDTDYRAEMLNSFCSRIHASVGKYASHYWRGPSLWGMETQGLAFRVASEIWIRDLGRRANDRDPLYLCGYSRGGAAVIIAARLISPRPVKAMFLFDAVDRTVLPTGASTIPRNVQRVYYAKRNPAFTQKARHAIDAARPALREATLAARPRTILDAFVGGDDALTSKARDRIDVTARMRQPEEKRLWAGRNSGVSDFGNCGLYSELPGNPTLQEFEATHGALGGVPWPDIKGDAATSEAVRSWMWGNFRKEGFLL